MSQPCLISKSSLKAHTVPRLLTGHRGGDVHAGGERESFRRTDRKREKSENEPGVKREVEGN